MVVTSICGESSEDLRSSPINMWRIIGGLKVMSNLGPYETDDDPMENLYLIQERGLPWELGSLDHNVTCLHMWPTLLERNSHLWEETITINIRVLSYILLMWWLFICKTANEQITINKWIANGIVLKYGWTLQNWYVECLGSSWPLVKYILIESTQLIQLGHYIFSDKINK